MTALNAYQVDHEKGGYIVVFAKDEEDAIDQYYESIKNIIGHQLKICSCYGDKPLGRSKVIKPTGVRLVKSAGS